ncbi:hypothetical protein [Clostridium homopropionicum]|nr:hypothetical protein [Clostridium homopropionicum]
MVRFISGRKKTILEKTISETIDILQEIKNINLSIFNEETLGVLEDIKEKLKYLNNINYRNENLNSLNGVLVELIRKYLDKSKSSTKIDIKLYASLINYKNFVDKIMLEIERE